MTEPPPIPLTVIGGWLGAGKTTLLNRILATAHERIAVVVNDIGEINVDAALLRQGPNSTDDEIIELTNGCVCCSIGDSLALTLRDLTMRTPAPDRIIVEASGVADPAQVAEFGDRRRVPLDAIITLAEVDGFERKSTTPPYGGLMLAQVSGADLVIATKLDLVSSEDRPAGLAHLRSRTSAPVIETADDPDWIRNVILGPHEPTDRTHYEPTGAETPVATRTWRPTGPVDLEEIEQALRRPGMLRAKGSVTTPHGAALVHLAGDRVTITDLADRDPLDAIVLIAESHDAVNEVAAALTTTHLGG